MSICQQKQQLFKANDGGPMVSVSLGEWDNEIPANVVLGTW